MPDGACCKLPCPGVIPPKNPVLPPIILPNLLIKLSCAGCAACGGNCCCICDCCCGITLGRIEPIALPIPPAICPMPPINPPNPPCGAIEDCGVPCTPCIRPNIAAKGLPCPGACWKPPIPS